MAVKEELKPESKAALFYRRAIPALAELEQLTGLGPEDRDVLRGAVAKIIAGFSSVLEEIDQETAVSTTLDQNDEICEKESRPSLANFLLDVYAGKVNPEDLEPEPFQEQLNQEFRKAHGIVE